MKIKLDLLKQLDMEAKILMYVFVYGIHCVMCKIMKD